MEKSSIKKAKWYLYEMWYESYLDSCMPLLVLVTANRGMNRKSQPVSGELREARGEPESHSTGIEK